MRQGVIITTFFLFALFISCVEPFEIKTTTFESALVVEASLTNELKNQTLKISRTFRLEESGIIPEENAIVKIVDDQNNEYLFTENIPGTYTSLSPFGAILGRNYQLSIKTADNRSYISNQQKINSSSPINNLIVEAKTYTKAGVQKEGIVITAESYDSNRNANYYRYEYEETYKITATLWSPDELKVIQEWPPIVKVVRRANDNKICYKTDHSNEIIQTETTTLSEDRVSFPVKFIDRTDFKIRNRYSLLVKQYIQSLEAYNYYKILSEISSSESLFSQMQPGTLIGNLISIDDKNENVLGFFEVASVSTKRVFLNYSDYYQQDLPPHIESCTYIAPELNFQGSSPLVENLISNKYIYFSANPRTHEFLTGPYFLVPKSCGDCTVLGSNIKPSFWID
jgi:hypothetical protein